MEKDPIVEEVREARRRIFWEECGGNWKRFAERMRAVQQTMKNRVVTKEEFEAKRSGATITR